MGTIPAQGAPISLADLLARSPAELSSVARAGADRLGSTWTVGFLLVMVLGSVRHKTEEILEDRPVDRLRHITLGLLLDPMLRGGGLGH